MKTVAIAAACVFALYASPTFAKPVETINELVECNCDFARNVVGAAGNAILSANSDLEANQQKGLICPPKAIEIPDDEYVSILRSYVQKHSVYKEATWHRFPVVLLLGLKERFPCP
jgi:hypothetical protein